MYSDITGYHKGDFKFSDLYGIHDTTTEDTLPDQEDRAAVQDTRTPAPNATATSQQAVNADKKPIFTVFFAIAAVVLILGIIKGGA